MTSLLRISIALVCLAAPLLGTAAGAQCTVTLDALVMRSGSAEIRAPAAPASPQLALASMGRLSIGGKNYSVWRIRNNTASRRRVTLYSRSTQGLAVLDVSAHADLFVRSEAAAGNHTLLAGLHETEVKFADQNVWHDARSIDDPLCAEPGTTLWVRYRGGFLRVSPIDGRVLLEIPAENSAAAAFAVDPVNGTLWIYGPSHLQAFSLRGEKVIDTRPEFDPPPVSDASVRLSIDAGHRVWLASGKQLFRLSPAGALLGTANLPAKVTQLEFDPSTNAMWVASASEMSSWRAGGSDQESFSASAQIEISDLRFIAVDKVSGHVWAAAGGLLRSFDSAGEKLLEVRLPAARAYERSVVDAHHGLWVAGPRRLTHFSQEAVSDFDTSPRDWSSSGIAALSADRHADTAWVVTPDLLWQYTQAGITLPLFGEFPATALAPQPGLLLPGSRRLEDVRVFDDFTPPELRVIAPADGAAINNRRPSLQLSALDREGRLDLGSVNLSINGEYSALECVETESTHLQCTLAHDLPQGSIRFALSISDNSGNRAAPVNWQITIDTVPPGAPASNLISVASAGASLVQVVGSKGAVEGDAFVIVRNLTSGAAGQGSALHDGSFMISINASGADVLQVEARDAAGNLSQPLAAGPAARPVLMLTAPADGAVVTDHDLIVRGTMTGASTAGVVVNGIPVNLTGSGDARAFEARVPLSVGANTIDAVAHLADGSQLQAHRAVTLANPAPFGVRVSAAIGVPPFSVTFAINEYGDRRAASVAYDFDGDGAIDFRSDAPQAMQSFTYTSAGEHEATILVTADDGSQYRYKVPIIALSRDEIDQQIRASWHQFVDALSKQAPERAAASLVADVAARIDPALQNLRSSLPSIAASFSEAKPNAISPKLAEYVLTREIAGDVKVFLIYFALDADGIWRLAGL